MMPKKLPKTERRKNEVIETITSRYSCRSFDPTHKLKKKEISLLAKAAVSGPSAGNLQAYEIYSVTSKIDKQIVASAAVGQTWAKDASSIIAICAHPIQSMVKYGGRGQLYSIQDATIAGQNLTIAAVSLGLGTCWIGAFDRLTIKNIFEIPDGIEPLSLICIGLPAQHESATKRTYKLSSAEVRQKNVGSGDKPGKVPEVWHFKQANGQRPYRGEKEPGSPMGHIKPPMSV